MNTIKRNVKVKIINGRPHFSIPKQIEEAMNLREGDLFEFNFDKKSKVLNLNKIFLGNKKFWFLIGDKHWWRRQIRDGYWNLDNPNSPDMKLFKSIGAGDVIIAYFKSPTKSIQNILITKNGFDAENKTIDVKNICTLKNPITYKNFETLGVLSDYRKMPRRSVVPLSNEDWNKISNIISERENIDLVSLIFDRKSKPIDDFLQKTDEYDVHLGTYEGYLKRGISKYKHNEFEKAIEYIEKSIEKEPNDDFPWYIMGLIFEKMGQIGNALKSYDNALSLKADNLEAWNNKGIIMFGKNKLDEAIICFDEAHEIDPDDPEPIYNKSITYRKKGQYEKALIFNDETILKDPNFYKALCNNGIILNELNKWEEALNYFDKALEINPYDSISLINKADALFEIGRQKEALQCIDIALDNDRNNENIWIHRGILYGRMNRIDDAMKFFDRAIEINPNNARGWSNKAFVFKLKGEIKKSVEFYEKALTLDPDNEEIKAEIEEL